jgi:predicted Zn-ribbon and HTH transcriptional regulator
MERTRRQQIVQLLTGHEWNFDDLRRELGLTVKILEEDLRHIERSIRADGRRLMLRPASCEQCSFIFKSRAFHPPGRCPECRNRRVSGPWIRIA